MGLLHDGEWEPEASRDQYDHDAFDDRIEPGPDAGVPARGRSLPPLHYQMPDVAVTCNMEHVTHHYYRSHAEINPTGFVPVGPDMDWTAPHSRDDLQ